MGLSDYFRRFFSGEEAGNKQPSLQSTQPPLPIVISTKPATKPMADANATKPGSPALPDGDSMRDVIAKVDMQLRGKRIAIIVGHEKGKPGAVLQFGLKKGMPEYVFNTRTAELLSKRLAVSGANPATIFRDHIGITGAYEKARAYRPDFVIELHFNSSADESASGVETLISSKGSTFTQTTERVFAVAFADEMNRLSPSTSRRRHGNGVLECRKEDRGGVNVNALGDIPSVLIEPFFGSNNLSCLSWTSDSGQSALVNAIIHALEFSIGTRRIV